MKRMPLPPFTWKSALLYLIGVIAVLVIAFLLVEKLMETRPRHSIIPRTQTTLLVHPAVGTNGYKGVSVISIW